MPTPIATAAPARAAAARWWAARRGADRPALLAPALLGVPVGAALQLQQPALSSAPVYAACALAALACAAVAWRGRPPAVVARALVLVAAALAMFACAGLRSVQHAATALSPALEGQSLLVTGTVADLPQATEAGVRFRLRVQSASQDGVPVAVPRLVDLGWYRETADAGASATPRAGERWQLAVRLKAPHGARNPHGFDYELRQWEQGVQAVGYVRTGHKDAAPQPLGATLRYPVAQLRERVRDAIARQLAGASDAQGVRAAGVVAALVTGDQRAIDRADWNVFRATGVAHLVSISGLHITLFAWLAAQLIGVLWRLAPRLCLRVPAQWAALVGGLCLATLYALFSGWGVPAQRTVLMLAVAIGLRLAGRRWPWPHVWLLACAAVVLLHPWALLQPGFWLSFVAVGVLFAIDTVANNAYPMGARGRFEAAFRQQWTVTLALAPLTLLLFGQVSLVGFFANLVAIPWVTLVVTPLAFAGVLWAPLWQAAAACVQVLSAVLGALAALPWAQLEVAAAPLWAGVAAALGGVVLASRLPWPLAVSGLALVLPALLWQAPRPPPGHFELLAVDVGQGNAVLVRTAGRALLYDTGPRYSTASDAGERVLVPLLRALGERVDTVMVSHRDSDHAGGAVAVLAQQPQARLTGSIAGEEALLALRQWTPCVAGQAWQWDGVHFEVLHPFEPAPGPAVPAARPNALSCVLRLRAANGASALLAGDIERAQEAALVAAAQAGGAPIAADLLLVPHHGSKTSSSAPFLQAVQPRLALVQAAYRSRFGHPAPEVVARLREHGAQVVESPRCGAATWRSDAPDRVRCEREAAPRFWQHRTP